MTDLQAALEIIIVVFATAAINVFLGAAAPSLRKPVRKVSSSSTEEEEEKEKDIAGIVIRRLGTIK